MCAIVGLLASQRAGTRHIQRMAQLMSHRGPDDQGFLFRDSTGIHSCLANNDDSHPLATLDYPEAWLALGHRRLSILDLSPLGHQPMCYEGRFWIVYNGEIYNYLELRTDLEAA